MSAVPTVPQIQFCNVVKKYGSVTAVKDLTLTIEKGEFLTILGPSGSGKTTTLMLLAGFEAATEGDILVGGKSVSSVPSYRRDQGIVFQNYALFPHLSVLKNLEFPLEMRGVKASERGSRAQRMLERVRLEAFENRLPSQLSGGQQQRVALARALIADAPILLLDEPLGALDRNLREQMQIEIKNLHKEFGTTTVSVTHDQDEALTMSDRIVVMRDGQIEQSDSPEVLYDQPSTRFVANFLGEANILDDIGVAIEGNDRNSEAMSAMIRPERLEIEPAKGGVRSDADLRQFIKGAVRDVIYAGPLRKYVVCSGGCELIVRQHALPDRPIFQPGENVTLSWLRTDIRYVSN